MPEIGLIAGSGIYEIPGLVIKKKKRIVTPFGKPSDDYRIVEINDVEIAFLPRHGSAHNIPPHRVNYRANIWGLKELGVKRIISVSAVGGISKEMKPGGIVIPDQVIDMTGGRNSTFYDGPEVVHIDFTEPYCPEIRKALIKAGKKTGIVLIKGGAYICTNGPRLESKAEIMAYKIMGADVVGMTAMPEASLARELEICFAGVSVVTNYAAGISRTKLTTTEVLKTMKSSTAKINMVLKECIIHIPSKRKCPCKDALKDSRMG
ncbi:MAG: S-methyl-5'-thioadenosine phosphorylase [Nitrospirae bacterium]|nr:S-methyl-5'-thioadenosine phosphorylase [Nitrospirota bacterium]